LIATSTTSCRFGDSPLLDLPEKPEPSSVFDSKCLPAPEDDLDLLLQLEEGEATACQGAPIFDNYSDSDDHITPFLGDTRPWQGNQIDWMSLHDGRAGNPPDHATSTHYTTPPTLMNFHSRKAGPWTPPMKKEV
jgi:hypothetical protein